MASRNYYVVLGVASTATSDGIRAAFRDRAKRLHPDRVGPGGAPSFRELTEAYDVLRDPSKRRAYDDSLRAAERRPAHVAARIDDPCVEVTLSREEADRGARVRVRLPTLRAVTIDVPPMSGSGTTFVMHIPGAGVVRVRVRVEGGATPPSP